MKKTHTGSSGKRGITAAGKRKDTSVRSGKQRRIRQFLACGTIFVALVAVKLLLPGEMESVSRTLGEALQKNMDIESVFLAVGNVITGEAGVRDTLEDVYQAVFLPQETAGSESVAVENLPGNSAALEMMRGYRQSAGTETTEEDAENAAYILYTEGNLPDNVILSQEILGFEYAAPAAGTLSSSFGYRRHPAEGEERFHYGIDLAAEEGTAVTCFADGTVTVSGESSSYGKYCVVSHPNGYQTLYAHCSRVTVPSGAEVRRGEKIAEIGETGMATGPHLHFELLRDGLYLNPIYYVEG